MELVKEELSPKAKAISELTHNFGGITKEQARVLCMKLNQDGTQANNDPKQFDRTMKKLLNLWIVKLSEDERLVLPRKGPYEADIATIDCLWVAINKAMYIDRYGRGTIDTMSLSDSCWRQDGVIKVTYVRDGVCYHIIYVSKENVKGNLEYLKSMTRMSKKEDFENVQYIFVTRDGEEALYRIWKDEGIQFPYKCVYIEGDVYGRPSVQYIKKWGEISPKKAPAE